MIVSGYILAHGTDDEDCLRLRRFIIIPLAAVIFGLIASTSHLGRPSNTLYVLAGVGRSPLSNEVVAVAAFTGAAWIAWLLSFAEERFRTGVKALLGASLALGVLSLLRMAGAYSIATIITWALPYTSINLLLAGLAGGPVLALGTMSAARIQNRRLSLILLTIATMCAMGMVVSELLQYQALQTMQGSFYYASDLIPFYPFCIAVSALLILGGIFLMAFLLIKRGSLEMRHRVAAIALSYGGIFVIRFAFYCMHMTAGL